MYQCKRSADTGAKPAETDGRNFSSRPKTDLCVDCVFFLCVSRCVDVVKCVSPLCELVGVGVIRFLILGRPLVES